MDGDFITINNKDGSTILAELYSKIEIENMGQFVLYKIDNEIYGAKYIINDNKTILDTDLSEAEKEKLNEIFLSLEVQND